MASLPCTVVSPTMVQATSSAQHARNPSVLPAANAALTCATMAWVLTAMGMAPLCSWLREPRDGSSGLSHAAERRRTTPITASHHTCCSPLDGILGDCATPAGDRPPRTPASPEGVLAMRGKPGARCAPSLRCRDAWYLLVGEDGCLQRPPC